MQLTIDDKTFTVLVGTFAQLLAHAWSVRREFRGVRKEINALRDLLIPRDGTKNLPMRVQDLENRVETIAHSIR